MRIVLTTIVGLATLLAACSNGETGPSGSSPAAASGSPPAADPPSPSGADPALAAIVEPVLAAAATRLGVDRAAMSLVSVEATTWSDGSLGCPKPGELYTQALVDGHQIVVTSGGATLDYRVTGPGSFRVCENPPSSEP